MTERLEISKAQFRQMLEIVSHNPLDLLLSAECRKFLARDRWEKHETHLMEVYQGTSQNVMPGTIAHNRREVEKNWFGSAKRSQRLLGPLSALDAVYWGAASLKVLSIGPRTEMEIFSLMAVGFQIENIFALDLISSSPFITAGDMHDMPYEDRSFDVVISSWVIGYSSNPQRAVDEMIRVCVDGGIIAIGSTYDPDLPSGIVGDIPNATSVTGTNYKSVDELKTLFGDKLDKIYFRQDAELEGKGAVMLIAKIKNS